YSLAPSLYTFRYTLRFLIPAINQFPEPEGPYVDDDELD
ncbi:MAG: hypothetical protein EZS28_051297, partial [Streblomastix strix]